MEIKRHNPANLPHRSEAVTWNGCVHLSGVMPSDDTADIRQQTAEVLETITRNLDAAGSSKTAIVSATVWLADLDRDFRAFNEVWIAWLGGRGQPARSTMEAKLHGKGLLEIAVIAAVPTT